MSFILDALKKSESERQRADAPALYEMKMAPRRRGVALWLLVLVALLVINIVVLTVVLIHGSHGTPAVTEVAPAPAAPAPIPAATPATAPVPAPAMTAAPPPVAEAPAAAAPAPAQLPPPSQGATYAPTANDAAPAGGVVRQSDDDAPATEAPRTPAAPATPSRAATGNVLNYEDVASTTGLNVPDLKLDLHAYAANPNDRFVLLNMSKLKEGQSTPAGVRVESITPDGAILSWQGQKFFLRRQ